MTWPNNFSVTGTGDELPVLMQEIRVSFKANAPRSNERPYILVGA